MRCGDVDRCMQRPAIEGILGPSLRSLFLHTPGLVLSLSLSLISFALSLVVICKKCVSFRHHLPFCFLQELKYPDTFNGRPHFTYLPMVYLTMGTPPLLVNSLDRLVHRRRQSSLTRRRARSRAPRVAPSPSYGSHLEVFELHRTGKISVLHVSSNCFVA